MSKSGSPDTGSPLYSFHSPGYHSLDSGIGQEAAMKFVGRQSELQMLIRGTGTGLDLG